ncbi:MAG TPA: hypothetical protein VN577_12280 [Terriglobales bacterium]|nr:hypothetical protein [Terriglobales bacterium]
MRKTVLVALLFCCSVAFATDGSFTGQVVNGPNLESGKKWVFVQGPKGPTRRVEISTAKVTYSAAVPKAKREAKPEDGVREGAEVRLTANQDKEGEWQASAIEILKVAPE